MKVRKMDFAMVDLRVVKKVSLKVGYLVANLVVLMVSNLVLKLVDWLVVVTVDKLVGRKDSKKGFVMVALLVAMMVSMKAVLLE
jgi:hypothetical protein